GHDDPRGPRSLLVRERRRPRAFVRRNWNLDPGLAFRLADHHAAPAQLLKDGGVVWSPDPEAHSLGHGRDRTRDDLVLRPVTVQTDHLGACRLERPHLRPE